MLHHYCCLKEHLIMKFFEIKRPNMVTIIGKGIKYNKPKNYKIRFIIYSSDDCGKGGT